MPLLKPGAVLRVSGPKTRDHSPWRGAPAVTGDAIPPLTFLSDAVPNRRWHIRQTTELVRLTR